MSRLIYIANARMPTEKAHGLQIANMCHAFAKQGMETTLVVPKRKNRITEDVFTYYGIEQNFRIRTVWSWDLIGILGIIGFWIQQLTFSVSAWLSYRKRPATDLVFSRDIFAAYLLSFGDKKVIYEMHRYPERFKAVWRPMLGRMSGIVSTNQWKADMLTKEMKFPHERIIVLPNGFEPALFDIHATQTELRKELGLPQDGKLALYTGHLYDWKGAHVFAEAARQIPSIHCVFVGGTAEDVARFKKEFSGMPNNLLVGQRPHRDVPRYLAAADVLVLPNSAVSHESRFSTSPIKLFEYLAAGKPIVASDLPSIREILGNANALFVPPDDPRTLANAVQGLLEDVNVAGRMSQENKKHSLSYTWEKRANVMMEWIQNL